ncbi:WD40-repeat-containing domain protein, partial [Dimargaris cristalligena]
EEKLKKVEQENSQLVDRWLRKMNEEADQMNASNQQSEARKVAASMDQINDNASRELSCIPTTVYKELENIHGGEVQALHVSPDGTLVATGGQDRRVKIFDSKTGNLRYTLSGCLQSVLHVWFNPVGDHILATSSDNAIRVWSLDTGRIQHTLTGHIGKVVSAKFDSHSRKIISVSHDRTIKSWDLYRGYCSKTIFSVSSCNDLCLMDPEGTTIFSGHVDNVLRMWDMRTGNCIREINRIHEAPITSLSISPGRRFVTIDLFWWLGKTDGSIYIWDALTAEVQSKMKEHTSSVCAVFWDSSGQHFFSAEKDQLVCFW